MDRLDYLSRDSYYTGVVEGIVGYDRILNMITVVDNNIVVEEKGVNSIEKFLIARYMMYSQVYLHKTSVAAELMLKKVIVESKQNFKNNIPVECSDILRKFLKNEINLNDIELFIYYFSLLDDYDIWFLLKSNTENQNILLKFLCESLLNRKLFKLSLQSQENVRGSTITENEKFNQLSFSFHEQIECYKKGSQSIMILTKDGSIQDLLDFSHFSTILNRCKKIYYKIIENN
jgi:HD superfamily phosphohydrolase